MNRTRGGVAFLIKHGQLVNKEYCDIDFNIITDNKALVTDIDLCNNKNLILATIYCPNGNQNFRLFETINNLSESLLLCQEKQLWSSAQKYSKSSKHNLLKQ